MAKRRSSARRTRRPNPIANIDIDRDDPAILAQYRFADPENQNRQLVLSKACVETMFNFEPNLRQQIALHNAHEGLDWYCRTAHIQGLQIVESELRVFLKEAGVRGPHYKPPARSKGGPRGVGCLNYVYKRRNEARYLLKHASDLHRGMRLAQALEGAFWVMLTGQYVDREQARKRGLRTGRTATAAVNNRRVWEAKAREMLINNPRLSWNTIAESIAKQCGIRKRTVYDHLRRANLK